MPLTLHPRPPFDLERSAQFLCAPPAAVLVHGDAPPPLAVDRWRAREYRRVIWIGQRPLLLRLRNQGLIDRPEVLLSVEAEPGTAPVSQPELRAAVDVAEHLLAVKSDLGPFYAAARLDPVLCHLRDRFAGLKLLRYPNLYESLVATILRQRVDEPAGSLLVSRLLACAGTSLTFQRQTYYGFPTPQRLANLPQKELTALGLPESKVRALHAAAQASVEGKLIDAEWRAALARPQGSADEALAGLTERLTALAGIGTWSAEMVLLRGLGIDDALPAEDTALRRRVAASYRLKSVPTPQALRRRWRSLAPWRGFAALYLWFTAWQPEMGTL